MYCGVFYRLYNILEVRLSEFGFNHRRIHAKHERSNNRDGNHGI